MSDIFAWMVSLYGFSGMGVLIWMSVRDTANSGVSATNSILNFLSHFNVIGFLLIFVFWPLVLIIYLFEEASKDGADEVILPKETTELKKSSEKKNE